MTLKIINVLFLTFNSELEIFLGSFWIMSLALPNNDWTQPKQLAKNKWEHASTYELLFCRHAQEIELLQSSRILLLDFN